MTFVVSLIFNIPAMLLILYGNCQVLVLFFRSKKIRSSMYNWLILNLVISEGIGGCLFVPNITHIIMSPDICVHIRKVIGLIMFNSATCSMLGLTLYQFLRIIYPLTFFRILTSCRVKLFIICTWTISVIISIHPLVQIIKTGIDLDGVSGKHECMTGDDATIKYMVLASLGLMIPTISSIIVMQTVIFVIVRRHIYQLRRVDRSETTSSRRTSEISPEQIFATQSNGEVIMTRITQTSGSRHETTGGDQTPQSVAREKHAKTLTFFKLEHWKRSIKAFRILIVVVFLFIFGWFPLMVAAMSLVLCKDCYTIKLSYFLIFGTVVTSVTLMVNPWLFALRLPDFKTEFKSLKTTTKFWFVCCFCYKFKCLKKSERNENFMI